MRNAAIALSILLACGGSVAQAQTPDAAATPSTDAPVQQKPPGDVRLDLQKPQEEIPKAAESWWQKILRDSPNCKSFSDGCRICSHTVCSNIGIACQPREWACNDAAPASAPDAHPEAKPETKSDAKP